MSNAKAVDRCVTTGKAAFRTRSEAKQRWRSSSGSDQVNVYRCVVCNHWHIGHVPAHVADGSQARFTPAQQARFLGVDDRVVRRCPSCAAEGTLRVGILHAVSCDWRKGDERLPLRR